MMQRARLETLSHLKLYNIAYYIRNHEYNKRMILTVNCLAKVLFCILIYRARSKYEAKPSS